ncbi:MAG: flagellar basal body rod protein FlgC [Aquificae bacterium]|nr:flagellar basal body rod protein FlgC [Aquificota bacterium]
MLDVFDALSISASGMYAQRIRMNTVASNLANYEAFRDEGTPFYRLVPVFEAVASEEDPSEVFVRVREIREIPAEKLVYDPDHPMADEEGYVRLPSVEPVKEMVDMITAVRSYEANLRAFMMTKEITERTFEAWK